MLSIETTKKLLSKDKISDEEAEVIRNDVRQLAEIVVEMFIDKGINLKLKKRLNHDVGE